jgi:hypothetical protein
MKKVIKQSPSDSMKIAGGLSDSDKQILRDHAATLKQQGTPAASRELERMNKMYRNYGLSFGSIKGV